jgi:hypothetical protein
MIRSAQSGSICLRRVRINVLAELHSPEPNVCEGFKNFLHSDFTTFLPSATRQHFFAHFDVQRSMLDVRCSEKPIRTRWKQVLPK